MPMNHLSLNFPEPIWLMDPTLMPISHQHDDGYDDANDDPSAAAARRLPREPMFEKPLTPSDVGKLNRLVIPKQHAERYFPLGACGESGEKGLLLSFEDESGKCWRFRYSYWNSSQSYVLTKGWSRYVKEKRLDAGDVVLFERHRDDSDRLFIGWRRSGAATTLLTVDGGGRGGATGFGNAGVCYPAHTPLIGLALPCRPERLVHAPGLVTSQGQRIATGSSATTAGNLKTLRLFGVNLECQLDEPSSSDHQQSSGGSHMSTSSSRHGNQCHYHTGINLQTGNRLG